jgi:hypothetical protein
MALGLQTESSGGGDFLPIVKYDGRAGRFFRRDRENMENTDVDITSKFKAVFDMENIEVGFVRFVPGAAPDFVLVPLGAPLPAKPSDDHKQCFRILVKLGNDCGGDVRELSSSAKVAIKGLDALHEAYLTGEKKNPGKLPVVVLKDTVAITTEGKQKSTNYQPVFEIVSWAPRPKDLIAQPRGQAQAPKSAPPSTGGRQVSAPEPAMAEEESFG